jgi:hypothetical protein
MTVALSSRITGRDPVRQRLETRVELHPVTLGSNCAPGGAETAPRAEAPPHSRVWPSGLEVTRLAHLRFGDIVWLAPVELPSWNEELRLGTLT